MTPAEASAARAVDPQDFDIDRARADFPILQQEVHDRQLVYLDNAATTQKPVSVIEALERYYYLDNANVHRAAHELSERATCAFEAAREKVRKFLHAHDAAQIVFVRGTTEAINLVAQSYGRANIKQGDEILITEMEHHSNIVPWQLLCEQTGAVLKVVPINDHGELMLDKFDGLLTERTKLVGMVHVSNALGTINPIKTLIQKAHDVGAVVLVDGAQAVAHIQVDVDDLDCDFYAFSGHKLYGPTGIGVLYGKRSTLEAMPPYQGGGEMIEHVSFEKTTYNKLPYKFEAGTPNIAGAIGLGASIDYVTSMGLGAISAHERSVLQYATQRAQQIEGLRVIGTAGLKCSILSFVVAGTHPADFGSILDQCGVAIRTGHHCAMPVMQHFDIPGTARASIGMYNTREEVDVFIDAVARAKRMLR
jgi:cysteine desulfurase/selenocysteine lyase